VRPSRAKPRDSRHAIFEAAALEFSAHGFAATSVDRIALRARVNKAMIYYHFGSKVRLYREILRDIFETLFRRAAEIAASPRTPDDKIRAFIDAVIREGEARPDFPRIMAREIADQGSHLDADTLRLMARIPEAVAGIIEEGVATGRFVDVDPLFCYFSLLGSMMFYLMSTPVRQVIGRLKIVDTDRLRADAFIAHLQTTTTRALLRDEARGGRPASRGGSTARRSSSDRPGDHA
jgi:TetR/AcrR family transcriptional regulator